jgi:glycosyltransferase involved in cell wall biosynthesis
MATLSVIIITKNEQSHIENCIKSVVGLADEIIVVDSQSTDRTAEIARSMGAKVSITTDWQGFGIQKNRALALSTSEWVLSLDADERVTPELALEIKSVLEGKTGDPRETCYLINRQSWYCGRLIKHSGWQEDKILRLFKRGAAEFTNDKVHERIIRTQHASNSAPAFKEGRVLNGLMLHYSFSDFDQVLLKVNR